MEKTELLFCNQPLALSRAPMYRKENGNSFLAVPLTSHPTSAMGTGRALSRWDGKNRKHNFCAFLVTPLSTATVSMYIQTAEQSLGLLADITWCSSHACGCYQQEQLCGCNYTKI